MRNLRSLCISIKIYQSRANAKITPIIRVNISKKKLPKGIIRIDQLPHLLPDILLRFQLTDITLRMNRILQSKLQQINNTLQLLPQRHQRRPSYLIRLRAASPRRPFRNMLFLFNRIDPARTNPSQKLAAPSPQTRVRVEDNRPCCS